MPLRDQFYTLWHLARGVINITNVGAISMRLTLAVLALGVMPGCEAALITPPGVPPPGTDGGPPVGLTPAEIFANDVEPRLRSQCATCHDVGGRPGVIFLEGASYYEAVQSWDRALFIPGDPGSSMLITIPGGTHTGGPWDGQGDVDAVSAWIVAEGEMPSGDGGTPMSCTDYITAPSNVIPEMSINIDTACDSALGLAGSRLELSTSAGAGGALSLTNLMFVAGRDGLAADGATFVLIDPATGEETPMASPFHPMLRLAAGRSESLSGGVDLPGYTAGMQLAVRFSSLGTN